VVGENAKACASPQSLRSRTQERRRRSRCLSEPPRAFRAARRSPDTACRGIPRTRGALQQTLARPLRLPAAWIRTVMALAHRAGHSAVDHDDLAGHRLRTTET
jgi:hypothetical protein